MVHIKISLYFSFIKTFHAQEIIAVKGEENYLQPAASGKKLVMKSMW